MHTPEAANGEVLDTDEYLSLKYTNLGIDEALRKYLAGDIATQDDDISRLLVQYAEVVAETALERGAPDYSVIRLASDHLTADMNDACREKFEKPKRFPRILALFGHPSTTDRTYVRELDDTYWRQQFPDEFKRSEFAQQDSGLSTQEILAQTAYRSMYGLLFAPFTYMR
jgi:hypothetical protein